MRIVYALEPYPSEVERTIFLAGPTPREDGPESWRPEAIARLERLGFDGTVFVPEPADGKYSRAYDEQIEWELEGLRRADCILFWIPRDLDDMPGFTTNVEFGAWATSGRVVLGAPPDAPKLRYVRSLAARLGVPQSSTLEDACRRTIEAVGAGAKRTGVECQLPFQVFELPTFQRWLTVQRAAGNVIQRLSLEWTMRTGPKKELVFLWVVRAAVYIAAEARSKTSEVVVGRPDVAAVVLYRRREPVSASEVVLVREFRAPAASDDAYVHEVPSGSSKDPAKPWLEVALEEVREEVGLTLSPERLRPLAARQLVATLSAHRAHAFACELTDAELDRLRRQVDPLGADGSERTFVEVWRLGDLMADPRVDWANVGFAAAALFGG